MYHADSHGEKIYVVTIKEMLFLVLIFISILIFLYPKNLLKQQIANENSNYSLSMLYLKNLILHSPEDESLILLLAEQSLRNGEREKSLKLLLSLQNSKDKKRRKQVILLAYELYKLNYNDSVDTEYRKPLRKKLQKLFSTIYSDHLDKKEDYDIWYNESIFNENSEAIYYYLEIKIRYEPKNIGLLESAYYTASILGKKKDTIKYLKQLIQLDKKNYDKWLEAYYYSLVNSKMFQQAELLLIGQSQRLPIWEKRLADFYFMRKEFKKASIRYQNLFYTTQDYRKKQGYYFKAVEALQAGSFITESISLAKKYEDYYIRDIKVRDFLLKLYIATGNLDYGVELSQKILKIKWQK